ncbi:hypothetical protein HUG17_0555 [Dermatophagoides farinae]|uniref:Piwi domain-containing protein n=1 Tax=Dermatophagoides farinae TaxID=6954 RepID=A0A9D4P6V5_DERFA|nr:hypothetical protein HUG17_0555 [Dermatophagoides farinae]
MDDCYLQQQCIENVDFNELENIFQNIVAHGVDYALFGIPDDMKINGISAHDIIKYFSLIKFGQPCQIFRTKNFNHRIDFDVSLFIKMCHRLGVFPNIIKQTYWGSIGFKDFCDSIIMAVNCDTQEIQGQPYWIMSLVGSKNHNYMLYNEAHVIGKKRNYALLREQLYQLICKYEKRHERMPKTVILYYNERNENDLVQIKKMCKLSMFSSQTESIKWVIINVVSHKNMAGKLFEKPENEGSSFFIADDKFLKPNEFILGHDSNHDNPTSETILKCAKCVINSDQTFYGDFAIAHVTDSLCYLYSESLTLKNQPLPLTYAINSTRQAFSRLNGKLTANKAYSNDYDEDEWLSILNTSMKFNFLHKKIANPFV